MLSITTLDVIYKIHRVNRKAEATSLRTELTSHKTEVHSLEWKRHWRQHILNVYNYYLDIWEIILVFSDKIENCCEISKFKFLFERNLH